jgi:cell wall-associated NlpC family hydrolase
MGLHTGIDGEFGRNTRWNLRRFEQAKHLQIDGVLTPDDARIMRRAMAAKFSVSEDGTPAKRKGFGGGTEPGTTDPGSTTDPGTETAPGSQATMSSDGLHAVAPADAPPEVQEAIAAGNKIVGKPYKYGGGHGTWNDSGYDCSGTVSYALHGAGLLDSPLSSGEFGSWGVSGKGSWMSIYYNSGHVYAIIAGLRLDTSGTGGKGPRWQTDLRTGDGYRVRHYRGL